MGHDAGRSCQVPVSVQIAYMERESRRRCALYARRVAHGTMSEQDAEREMNVMRSVIASLLRSANLSAMFCLDTLDQAWVREWLMRDTGF